MMRRRIAAIALLFAYGAGNLFSQDATAQSFPARPVHVVVPYTPGGGVDFLARVVARKLGEKWTKGVVVENRPGASTIIGTEYVAKSPPDGTTILLCTTGFSVNISLMPKLPYDTLKDFAPVALAAMAPNVIIVHPSVPATTLKDLIAYAKANPNKLTYGYPGVGTASHLAAELFKSQAGVDAVGVAYKGTQPMLAAILGGEINYMLDLTGSLSYVRAGKLRALAVTSNRRLKSFPDIPTVAESGLPGYEAITWYGFVVRAGTPPETVDLISREINEAIKSPDAYARITSQGLEVLGSTPQEFERYIRDEASKWAKVVHEAHITVE